MKRMAIIFCSMLLMLLGSVGLSAQEVKLQATVVNPHSSYLLVIGPSGEQIDSLSLDPSGNCVGSFSVEAGTHRIYDGAEYFTAHLEPGYDLRVYLDADSFDETIRFEGVGADVNNFLAASYLFNERLDERHPVRELYSLDEGAFLAVLDSSGAAFGALIASFVLNPDLAARKQEESQLNRMLKLSQYPGYHAYLTKDESFSVSEDFPDPLRTLDLNRPDLLEFDAYRSLVNNWINNGIQDELKVSEGKDYWLLRAQKAISLENPEVRETALQEGSTYGFRSSAAQEELFKLYMDYSTDDAFKERMTTAYTQLKKIAAGEPSPTFHLRTVKGDSVKLSDLKGKLVYIDIWATWCGPCIREIPFLKELEHDYHGKDVHFVSIAGSSEMGTWSKMVADMELGGIQLYAPDGEAFMKDYQIMGYPTFILLDRELRIVDSDAKRPSDPELRKQLDGLLNQ